MILQENGDIGDQKKKTNNSKKMFYFSTNARLCISHTCEGSN